jgi:putative SOS response-associated peptidase YedK
MCNLYSITTNQAAIIALFRVMNRYVGNLPPMPGVFPDYPAPVVRNAGAERELTMMRWGMPPQALQREARQDCQGEATGTAEEV